MKSWQRIQQRLLSSFSFLCFLFDFGYLQTGRRRLCVRTPQYLRPIPLSVDSKHLVCDTFWAFLIVIFILYLFGCLFNFFHWVVSFLKNLYMFYFHITRFLTQCCTHNGIYKYLVNWVELMRNYHILYLFYKLQWRQFLNPMIKNSHSSLLPCLQLHDCFKNTWLLFKGGQRISWKTQEENLSYNIQHWSYI